MSGIPYPDNLTPAGGNLVALAINEYWFSVLFGFAKDALNRHLWDVTDEQWADEVEPAILSMLGVDTVACDGLICDVKFEDGVLSVKKGGEWVSVDGTEDIVTGVGFVDGGWEVEQGGEFETISAECEDPCDHYPDKPAYDGSGEARSCSIATNLVEWVMEKYQDSLDLADAAVNTITAADAILAAVPPVYFVWDALTDAVDEFYDATIAISRALDTVGLRDDMKEFLYCELVANSNIMSEEVWDSFKDEFAIIGDSIWLYLGAFKYDAIENEAHKASYGEESGCETFDCQCIPDMIDFETTGGYTVTQGARTAAQGNSGYAAFQSVTSSDPTGGFIVTVEVEVDFGGSAMVGSIDYDMRATRTQSPTDADKQFQQWVEGWNGSSWVALFTTTSGDIAACGTFHSRSRSWTPASYSKVRLRILAGWGSWAVSPETGTISIDNICIK